MLVMPLGPYVWRTSQVSSTPAMLPMVQVMVIHSEMVEVVPRSPHWSAPAAQQRSIKQALTWPPSTCNGDAFQVQRKRDATRKHHSCTMQ